jgi:hypothetical protein
MPAPIYIFDTAPLSRRREWAAMIGNATDADWDPLQSEFRTQSGIISDGVVVIHRSQFVLVIPDIESALKALAHKHKGLALIVVSGGAQPALLRDYPSRFYFRQGPVCEPVDEQFGRCFVRFIERYEQGTIDFGLLEPPSLQCLPALAILCQGYLAVYASHFAGNSLSDNIAAALEDMGWNKSASHGGLLVIKPNFGSSKDWATVTDANWWWTVFAAKSDTRQSNEINREAAIAALRNSVVAEWPDHPFEVSKLLEMIESGAMENPDIVAEAYCGISRLLGGKGITA